MGLFMAYGFVLIYLRDFAPNAEEWANNYSIGKHFESRLAHVHGNLFAFLNILIGYLLMRFRSELKHTAVISWLALIGLLMPIGILAEVYLGLPAPCFGTYWRNSHDHLSNLAWDSFFKNENNTTKHLNLKKMITRNRIGLNKIKSAELLEKIKTELAKHSIFNQYPLRYNLLSIRVKR